MTGKRKNNDYQKKGSFQKKVMKYLMDNAFEFLSVSSMVNGSFQFLYR